VAHARNYPETDPAQAHDPAMMPGLAGWLKIRDLEGAVDVESVL
jgi:hypothetical protein